VRLCRTFPAVQEEGRGWGVAGVADAREEMGRKASWVVEVVLVLGRPWKFELRVSVR
jgi:hypothetical protein